MLNNIETRRALFSSIHESEQLLLAQLASASSRSSRKRLLRQHRIHHLLRDATAKRARLLRTFDAPPAPEQDEVNADTFYDAVKRLRAGESLLSASAAPPELPSLESLAPLFSPVESFGRFLDLEAPFQMFLTLRLRVVKPVQFSTASASGSDGLNSNAIDPLSYREYLDRVVFDFSHPLYLPLFDALLCASTFQAVFDPLLQYLSNLGEYLHGFLVRTRPIDTLFPKEDSESHYASSSSSLSSSSSSSSTFDSISDSISDSIQHTSDANSNSDLSFPHFIPIPSPPPPNDSDDSVHCAACQKPFKRTVYAGHLQGKAHRLAEKRAQERQIRLDTLERWMRKITRMGEALRGEVQATVAHLEHKLSQLSVEYRQEDYFSDDSDEADEAGESSDDEEEKELSRSIRNYPMGPDGNPLPYWMYKAQGLGLEFKCEICGNASYFGPKAFTTHFQKVKHIQGLKALGIPYSQSFHLLVRIKDAEALWKQIQKRAQMTNEI